MEICLKANNIWDEWAKIIAENMKLVNSLIWDEWVQALMDRLELKWWVCLNLWHNPISNDMKQKLKDWKQSYNDKWVKCEIKV